MATPPVDYSKIGTPAATGTKPTAAQSFANSNPTNIDPATGKPSSFGADASAPYGRDAYGNALSAPAPAPISTVAPGTGSPSDTQSAADATLANLKLKYGADAGYAADPSSDPNISMLEGNLTKTLEAINSRFDSMVTTQERTNEENLAATNAAGARAGLTGSPLAGSNLATEKQFGQEAVDAINSQRNEQIAAIYSTVDQQEIAASQAREATANTEGKDYIDLLSAIQTKAQASIASMAQGGISLDDLQTSDPVKFNKLLDQAGMDATQAKALWTANIPKEQVISTQAVGNNMIVFYQDPLTGKVKQETLNTGVNLSPNAKPIFDPQTGTTYIQDYSQDGTKTLSMYDPINNSWTYFKQDSSGNWVLNPAGGTATPGAQGNAQSTVPTAVGSGAGKGYDGSILQGTGVDPKATVKDLLAPQTASQLQTIFSAMAKAEGGSPTGVQNNPLNLKYVAGMQGATDSGVKAQDGGTFASFPDQATAYKTYAAQLASPIYSNLSVNDALVQWSGGAAGGAAPQPQQPFQANDASMPNPSTQFATSTATYKQTGLTEAQLFQNAITIALNGGSPRTLLGGAMSGGKIRQTNAINGIGAKASALATAAGTDEATLQSEWKGASASMKTQVSFMNQTHRALQAADTIGSAAVNSIFAAHGVNPTDAAWANSTWNDFLKNFGSAGDVRAYQAKLQEAGNEYQQVFARGSASGVTDTVRNAVSDIINGNVPLGQMSQVLDSLQQAGQQALQASADTIQSTANGEGLPAVSAFFSYIAGVRPSDTGAGGAAASSTDYTSILDSILQGQ